MTEARPSQTRLVALAGVLLAACGGSEDGDSTLSQPNGALPGALADAAAIFPGTMPLPPLNGPDAALTGQSDPSSWARPDGGVLPARPDAGPLARPDGGLPGSTPGTMTPITRSDGGVVDISMCTPPAAGTNATAVKAWMQLNQIRLAGGAGCTNMVPTLNQSAQSHCDYKAMNKSNASCTGDAHTEISGCPGFTGADVQSREIAAGYPRALAYTEVAFTYGNNPDLSIPGWLATPFHRIPMLDPWTTDMGWGGGPGCDVIDFGRGMVRPADSVFSVYPYDGQTDVPTSFNGLEAPQPPAPPSGWPSSYPISVYAQRMTVSEHVLTKDGDPTPLEHLWLDTQNPGVAGLRPYFTNTALLYGAVFAANTKYHVKVVGTYAGGALNIEWSFTTGANRPFGF